MQSKTTWWSDVIASREYNGIVSIHIMLLTANISQLLAIATLPGTDDSGQKVPLVAMCCSDHFIVHVLHTLRIQSQGRVETYSIQLSTRMVYLVQVLKIYYYVEKLTLQAWHYIIAWRSKLWRSRFYAQNKSGNIQVQHVTLLLKTYSFRGELNCILSGTYQCSRCRAALGPSV